MNYRTKIFWIDNAIWSCVILVIADLCGFVTTSSWVVLVALLLYYWRVAIMMVTKYGFWGGSCVHCGGALEKHIPPLEGMIDAVCLCKVPNDFCPCTGYQPSRRWLDNLPKENRDDQ